MNCKTCGCFLPAQPTRVVEDIIPALCFVGCLKPVDPETLRVVEVRACRRCRDEDEMEVMA